MLAINATFQIGHARSSMAAAGRVRPSHFRKERENVGLVHWAPVTLVTR